MLRNICVLFLQVNGIYLCEGQLFMNITYITSIYDNIFEIRLCIVNK